jgi:hypothetical protein
MLKTQKKKNEVWTINETGEKNNGSTMYGNFEGQE